ncbi:MAG: hypothetical protein QNL05_12985 [Gammaproteobacteria bacterium]|nr:hypothetical protein [Gammaproteobacteria bacterium]
MKDFQQPAPVLLSKLIPHAASDPISLLATLLYALFVYGALLLTSRLFI